jgi:hypothetical protein
MSDRRLYAETRQVIAVRLRDLAEAIIEIGSRNGDPDQIAIERDWCARRLVSITRGLLR